jgi:hypothetical protein
MPVIVSAQTDFISCTGAGADACDACDLVTMMNTIIGWLVAVAVVIAALLFVYAGFKLVTSRGDVTQRESAKSIFINVLIGLALLLLSWTIVDTIMKVLLNQSGQIGVWNEISCNPQPSVNEPNTTRFAEASSFDSSVSVIPGTVQVNTGPYPPQGGEAGTPLTDMDVTVNEGMNPIFDPEDGGSHMVRPGAADRMQETLAGPFSRLQESFGEPIMINDAIAKDGTSRETQTPGSRHFHGDALDISVAGMSNADRIRLFEEAQRAGFTGFGFGNNILHVDRGPARGWSYGNSTYGGVSTRTLIGRTH